MRISQKIASIRLSWLTPLLHVTTLVGNERFHFWSRPRHVCIIVVNYFYTLYCMYLYICTYLGKTSGLPEGPDSRTQLNTFFPTAAATENYPTKYQITKCDSAQLYPYVRSTPYVYLHILSYALHISMYSYVCMYDIVMHGTYSTVCMYVHTH